VDGGLVDGGLKDKLHRALMELGLKFTADAVEHSRLIEAPGRLYFETTKEFKLALRDAEIQRALEKLGAGKTRVSVSIVDSPGEVKNQNSGEPAPQGDAGLMERALGHPEVQRFRETFGGQVRAVRNLKEYGGRT